MDFVIGHPRSGTTLLTQLLNAGSVEVCGHEYLCLLSSMAVPGASEYYAGRVGPDAITALLRHYDYTWSPHIRIDSNWKLTWMLPVLLERFPDARILHLARDPRTNVRSCYNLDYYGFLMGREELREHAMRKYWLTWLPKIRRPDWSRLSQLERNCAFWSETHRLALACLSGRDRYRRLRVEEIDNDEVVASVFAFFGLACPPLDRIARIRDARPNHESEMKQRIAGLRPPLPEFKDWTESDRQVLTGFCGDIALQLGYAFS